MSKSGTVTIIALVLLILSGAGIFFGYKNFSQSAQKGIAINNQSEKIEKDYDNNEIIDEKQADKNAMSNSELAIKDRLVGWGFAKGAESRAVDTIVIHSSYNALSADPYDLSELIREYKEYGVAPHYLIDRGGSVYRLVKEDDIAYHAGESRTPDGRKNVNNFSIGIEMMNTKEDECTAKQYAALNALLTDLKSKYKIKYVLGHNEIAPDRKDDPWNFEWSKLKK